MRGAGTSVTCVGFSYQLSHFPPHRSYSLHKQQMPFGRSHLYSADESLGDGYQVTHFGLKPSGFIAKSLIFKSRTPDIHMSINIFC